MVTRRGATGEIAANHCRSKSRSHTCTDRVARRVTGHGSHGVGSTVNERPAHRSNWSSRDLRESPGPARSPDGFWNITRYQRSTDNPSGRVTSASHANPLRGQRWSGPRHTGDNEVFAPRSEERRV